MHGPYRIEAYAIASSDGHLAASDGLMPDSLKLEEDQRFFEDSLNKTAVVVHGRMSYEGQANSPRRKRIILTRKVAATGPDPANPNAIFWNPAGATFEEAAKALGVASGTVGVLGGPDVYSLFLKMGYDDFYMCHAAGVTLPGGVPVFAEQRTGKTAEQVLEAAGLKSGPVQRLGPHVTLVEWTPEGGSTLAGR